MSRLPGGPRGAGGCVVVALAALVLFARPAHAQDEDIANEFRLMVSPHHAISKRVAAFSSLGYFTNPVKQYQVVNLGFPGVTYGPSDAVQIWASLTARYTDNQTGADKLELRPAAGVKLFVPNGFHWNLYDFTRYELRETRNLETAEWSWTDRVRSQLGVEFPIAAGDRPFKPETWYGLTDAEVFYRFDKDTVDPLRARLGLGRVLSGKVRMEFVYCAQFTRPAGSSALTYTDNIFFLNFKLGTKEGVMGRIFNPGAPH